MAIFSLSGNIPVLSTGFIKRVSDLVNSGSITFNNFVESPSGQLLFFVEIFLWF